VTDSFEDHCWKDVIPDDILKLYSHYRRDLFIGPKPALLAIDLYELAYQGGPKPVSEVARDFPSSCGINAWTAIKPTVRLFAAARQAGLPIFYTTGDDRKHAKPTRFTVTNRRSSMDGVDAFKIRPEWAPQDCDVVVTKQRASGFYGTSLTAHLTALGIDTVIVCGESTSGCVRASTVDGYSNGFHMVMAEECCFDRSDISHKVNLFDLHHKYADVMRVNEIIEELDKRARS
jgi:nicotinamidase-related amidase